MTAAASSERPVTVPGGSLPWRPLAWVAWRQHRTALAVFVVNISLVAIYMAVTGVVLHRAGSRVFSAAPNSQWHLFDATDTLLRFALPLLPALAGLFLGAPLIARELETGAARFTWVQGAGRTRWLVATAVPVAVLLAVVASGLGFEYQWWANPMQVPGWGWRADVFGLNPLPFAGWMVAGFALGVFFGAVIRRTVAAIAATLACYIPLLYGAASWRLYYLPPLHRAGEQPLFTAGGGYGFTLYFGSQHGARPDILNTALGWPDGRLLSASELDHSPAWLRLHHIQVWLTYQPGSRYMLFQFIEFGWLIVLSAILIIAAHALIRRRAA